MPEPLPGVGNDAVPLAKEGIPGKGISRLDGAANEGDMIGTVASRAEFPRSLEENGARREDQRDEEKPCGPFPAPQTILAGEDADELRRRSAPPIARSAVEQQQTERGARSGDGENAESDTGDEPGERDRRRNGQSERQGRPHTVERKDRFAEDQAVEKDPRQHDERVEGEEHADPSWTGQDPQPGQRRDPQQYRVDEGKDRPALHGVILPVRVCQVRLTR